MYKNIINQTLNITETSSTKPNMQLSIFKDPLKEFQCSLKCGKKYLRQPKNGGDQSYCFKCKMIKYIE